MTEEKTLKAACKFCGRQYRLKSLHNFDTINCQSCLVDFYWREEELDLISYRLKHEIVKYVEMEG